MASFINIATYDVNNQHAKLRIPVTAASVPTGYDTYANALLATIYGSGLPGLAGVSGATVEIDLGVTPIAPTGSQDARLKWQATMFNAADKTSRLSLPGRNPLASLITGGTEIVAAIGSSPWPAVLAALIASSGGVHMVNPVDDSNIATWGPVVAVTRSRKRPRVGGKR